MYEIKFHKSVIKEIDKLRESKLDGKLKKLIKVIKINPYQNPPPYEKLLGELKEYYSRRINIQHRLIYKVNEETKIIQVVSVFTHYDSV